MRSKQNKKSPLMILCGDSKNAVQAIYRPLNKKTPNLQQKVSKLGVFFIILVDFIPHIRYD